MRYRSRTKWTTVPAANAHPVTRAFLRGVAVHWVGPAVPAAVLAGDEAAVARYLRGILRYHRSKGWSDIAYNLAVDTQGRIWDLRGLGYRSAANGDEQVNATHLAIVALIGEHQTPPAEMLVGIRKAVRRCRWRYPYRCREIVGHRDLRRGGTECPGQALYLAVKRDEFRVRRVESLLLRWSSIHREN